MGVKAARGLARPPRANPPRELEGLFNEWFESETIGPRIDAAGIADVVINPLGYWEGGPNVDTGAVNRKLGSDMGNAVTGGGLHGKDLSKADVTLNIVCHILAQTQGQCVQASCSIGDEDVTFIYHDNTSEEMSYADCIEMARLYILTDCDGSFEKFAEWGLIR